MSFFDSISPEELSILANFIAIAISKNKSATENNIIGNFITEIGATILTIAAQQENLNSIEEKQKQIQDLEAQIKQLKSGY